ncbi:uncharacterized protein [Haliotis cracherodii]|uniref:uncharacterized protein n=1 Tax=Haliotis cracherodii TaxID=6455 RepID=UPI0039E9213F
MEKGRIDMRRNALTWAAVFLICFSLVSGQVGNQAPRVTPGQQTLRVVKTAPVGTNITTLNAVDVDGPSPVNFFISDFATNQLVQLNSVPGSRSSIRVELSSSLEAEPPSTKSLYIVASDGRLRTTATITLQVINPVSPILTGLNTTGLLSNPPDVQTVASNLRLLTETLCDLYTNQSPVSESLTRFRLFCLLFKAVYSQLPPSIFNPDDTTGTNNPPVFTSRTSFTVREGLPAGYEIGQLIAVDDDGPEEITFNLRDSQNGELFRLGNPSGQSSSGRFVMLYLRQSLDRQRTPREVLYVTAEDGQSTSTATVIVNVVSANNNPPMFVMRNTTFTIGNSSLPGLRIGSVFAIDRDSGNNGRVSYSFRTVNSSMQTFFSMNPSDGSIYLKRKLPGNRNVTLIVTAVDGGGMTTTANVTVLVRASNGNTSNACGNSTCMNGATCISRGNRNYTCSCRPGFTGVNCTYRNSTFGCLSNPCLNGATCLRGVNNSYRCYCRFGYTGYNCASRNTSNACGNSTCMNGATCISRGNRNYTCSCRPGFTGVNCTYRNSTFGCLSNPCLNGATCVRGVNNSYRCYCRFGYTGYNCASKNSSNACGNSTCMNGATCISRGNRNYTCSCRPGFTGVNCTYRNSTFGCLSNPCLNGATCVRGVNNSYRCYCRFGYTGYNCASRNTSNACGNSTCMNGATCISRGNRNYTCSCRPGFTGVNCTYRNSTFGCLSNPCLNGATCVRGVNNSYRCYCRFGYTGYNCASKNSSNACGNSTCMNGATCISRGNRNYTCSCRPGFTGVNCTYRNSTFGCLSNPCLNGATCVRGVNNSYRCYCRFGYTGYNCASKSTSNACGNSTCMNGATCISRGNRNYTCSCSPGFTGVNCTYRNSTFGCLSNPCLNGATCVRGVNNSYRCYCRFGYTGYNCASKNSSNACGNSTCMNGATCISRGNRNYTCSCRPGFTGVNCTYRNSTFGCLSNPCLNGATCVRGVNNSYRCYCRFGYTGYNCASKNTSNACGNSTCMNGATCISRGNRNYTCSCRPGFTGVNCTYRNSTFGCLSNPCLNGATCVRGVNNSYRCYCRFGYTGYNCASRNTSNACGNNTCMNGATCISRGNRNYTCSCRPGFTGVNCTYRNSTFGCLSNPCLNGATCVRGVNNSYRCNCRSGYTGYNCASMNTSNPCGTCRNGGSCIRAMSGGYMCNCLAGFSGDNCEYTEGTPRFMVRSTTVNVSEAAPIGTQLLRLNLLSPTQRVAVSSSDRTGTIRLSLTILGSSAFISVSLGRSLDRERVNRMNFTIFAYDGNYGDSTKLILNITDVNDEAPIFTSPVYIAVNKATPVGATLMIVNATDADAGQNGNVSYSIYGGTSGANRFRLNRTSGVLSVNGSLSTITADTVSLYIQAKDNGSPSLSTIATISIRLSNSAIPANSSLRFQPNVYSTSVPENSNRGSFLVQLALVDADQRLGGLAMSLRDPTNTVFANDFIINNNVTYISLRLNQTLDREVLTSKTVVVIATTKTPPLISATCTVNIQIVDVNDNWPVFQSPRYTATVQSGIQVGSMVAAVSATDSDTGNAGQVFYRFTQRSTEFSINVNTGLITTQATLSRIANTVQTIEVIAQDNGTPPLSATVIVDIQVTGQPDDTGNTGPVFDRSQVNVIVRENLPANTVVTTLTARYSNAGQSISFIMEDDYNSLFTLQPTLTNTGSRIAIVANGPIDREISPRYLLKVIAMGGRQEATATVTVGVQDVNDNAPVFSQQLYISSIPASTPVSSIILQTQATDADIGNNGQVTYRKQTNTAQDLSGPFQVESSTGRVIIVASLANLAGRTVNFSVIATDDGTPAQLSTTNVTIRVIGDGDNQSPVIQGVPTTIRVPENTPTGTILMLVLASDLDGPNRVTLTLPDRESFDTVQIGGSISNETASLTRITLNTFLNRELEATKVFRIVASDGQDSVTSTVTIVIEDVNDNTPTFTSSSYSSTLSTSMGVGTSVLTVSATDPDQRENGTVQYSIQSSTAPGYFSVNQNTGVILVTNSLTSLDGQTVTLRVEARDSGLPLSLNASVLVRLRIQSSPVTVEDNVAPTFPQQVMTFTVRENNMNGSYIGPIRALDADGPEAVTMRIAGDTAFNGGYLVRSLLSQTGDNSLITYLGINTVFDRERDPENNTVLLIASDGLAETTATVMIRVEDLNDNVPVFTLPTYTASVAESSPVNTIVIQLGASDADSGLFGEITYTMRSSDPIGSQAFRIDERTGTIMTAGSLSGRTGSLVLTVTATDGGRRPSTVDVNVTIV